MEKKANKMLALVKSDDPVKTCSKCEQVKPATSEFFPKNPMGTDGLKSVCKVCTTAGRRQWRETHREEAREIGREEQRQLRERRGYKMPARRATAAATGRVVCTGCGEDKPLSEFPNDTRKLTGVSSWCRQCAKKASRANHRARLRGHWATRLLVYAKQRSSKYAEPCDLSVEYLSALYDHQGGLCYWFGTKLLLQISSGLGMISLDRLDCSRGYVQGNVVLSCKAANTARGDASVDEFSDFLEPIIKRS